MHLASVPSVAARWRRSALRRFSSVLLLAALGACGSDEATPAPAAGAPVAPLGLAEGCQPLLAGKDCFLPFPSDFYLVDDASLPAGKRVKVTGAAKLTNDKGQSADMYDVTPVDGASKTPLVVGLLASPVTTAGLVGLLDPLDRSTTDDSPTLLLEADTGARVPHFVDVDIRDERPDFQALVITPVVGLKARTRYVAAIRRVKGPDGALAQAPEGFVRLRDRVNDPSLAALAARYEQQVFGPLDKAGAARAELQLAWDFTTGSDELVARDLLRVRELTLAWLAANPKPAVTITKIDELPGDPMVWRTVRGKVQIPLFLTSAEPGSGLFRDGSGQVAQNGEAQVDFVARVPASVRDRFEAARPLAYGHGFFGSRDEITDGGTTKVAAALGMVFFSIDWWGMSSPDLGFVLNDLVGKPDQALAFTERLHQAMANWTVVSAAISQSLPEHPELRRPAEDGKPGTSKDAQGNSNAGAALYDPSRVYFLGISQGHILGGTLAAFNPLFDRIALNVGGASFGQMMFRARPFNGFLQFLQTGMQAPFLQRKYTATMQPIFDRIDPAFWASHVLADKLPQSPADRRVLLQTGLGDSQVPNLGSFLHARLLGLPQITPAPQAVFGLEQKPGPIDGSAYALYETGVDPASVYALPKGADKENEVHTGLRQRPDVLDQLDQFLRPDSRVVVSDKK